jgi:dihydroxy-acid dehydratase
VAPEAALGGGLALLKDGDMLRIDLNNFRCDLLLSDAEIASRRAQVKPHRPPYLSPWEQIHAESVAPLEFGACSDFMLAYRNVGDVIPRDNH